MKIVLIGAGGFLGKALLKSLQAETESDHELHIFSSSMHAASIFPAKIHSHYYHWPECSLADPIYKDAFEKADAIIYVAGGGIQPKTETEDATVYALNIFEPARLVNVLNQSAFKGQLITFGSYFESGINQPQLLLSESAFLDQWNSLPNVYCKSKKELSHFHYVHQNIAGDFIWLHLILTNIYGPGENENRLIPYIISQSKLGQPLHFTSGEQVRQYTFVDDVAKIVIALLGKAAGLYHVTNKETVNVKTIITEVVNQVKWSLGLNPELYFDLPERRDTGMEYLAVNPKKLYQEWQLLCPTTYQQGIKYYFNQ